MTFVARSAKFLAAGLLVATLAACSTASDDPGASTTASGKLTVVTHDSFQLPDELKTKFAEESGLDVTYVAPGESGSLVEIGYTIFPPWRRKGYAYEMVRGYGQFASARGLRWLRLSIAPGNEASLALARKLGVRMIGSQIDEIDGPEDIYLLDL